MIVRKLEKPEVLRRQF